MKTLIVALLVGFSTIANADIFENLSNGIKSGNAKEISKYFSNSIDLTILSNEEVYSRAHAEQLIQDFFNKNPVKSFNIIHNGLSKEGAKFAIGKMVSANGSNFRIYVLIRQTGSTEYIQEFRIERE